VVNINAALGAIQEAMDSAELDAEGLEVETVLVSFAGGGVEGSIAGESWRCLVKKARMKFIQMM
jgi:cell division ATPase FtsA